MKEGVYIINSKSYQFIVSITKTVFDQDDFTLEMTISPLPERKEDIVPGILGEHCLKVSVNFEEGSIDATMDELEYNEFCSTKTRMEKNIGTFEMVMSTLHFCKHLFGVTQFRVHDASYFNCVSVKRNINMRPHSLLVHGKAFYERRFGAVPSSNERSLDWERSKTLLRADVEKEFVDTLVRILRRSNRITRQHMNEFLDILSSSDGLSWNGLFRRINDLKPYGCGFFDVTMEDLSDKFKIPVIQEWTITLSDEEHLYGHEKI